MNRVPGVLGLVMVTGVALAGEGAGEDALNSLYPLSLDELVSTPVVTASRHSERRESTPAHIMVFTREQIRDRRYLSLADLLEDLPGVDFQRGTRSGQFNHFAFQGHLSNNKLLILLDGVRIDHPVGGKIAVADNFSLQFAQQVEVLYGPAAALYGADAFAGVINIITSRAEQAPGGRLALSAGSFDTGRGEFQVGGELLGEWRLSASGHQMHSDRAPLDEFYPASYPRVPAGGVPAAGREDYAGDIDASSHQLRLDHGRDFTLGYYANRFRSLTSTGDAPASTFYLPEAFYDSSIDTLYASYRYSPHEDLQAELVLDHSTYEVDPHSRYVNRFTGFGTNGYDYAWARRRGIEQHLTWQLGERHTLQGGLGYRDYRSIETPDMPFPYDPSRGPSGQGMTYGGTPLPLQIFESRYYSLSQYLQWQARWSRAFSTMAGLRRDEYQNYGVSLNPRIGAIWQVAPQSYIKLLYGEAFRIPSPEEMYSAFGSFSGSGGGLYQGVGFRTPNEQLMPEQSRSLSLTWDWRPRPDFNLVTSAYHTRVDSVITTQSGDTTGVCPFDPALLLGGNQYIPGAVLCGTSTKANAGEDRYWGIDVIPQWRQWLGHGWSAEVWGSYSFIQGVTRESAAAPEQDQINLARHKLKLGTTFRYENWLTVTPQMHWIGPTSTGRAEWPGAAERLKTAGYRVFNLRVGLYELGDAPLSFYLDVCNLTDERYYAAHTSSSSAVLLAVPQQPRTLLGTLKYRF